MKAKINVLLIIFMTLTLILSSPSMVSSQTDTQPDTGTKPDTVQDRPDQTIPAEMPEMPEDIDSESPPLGEVTSGDFLYKPAGRRDPFWDLLMGKSVKIKREEKEGIAGLLIDELELEGILFKKGEFIALFKGPDGKPYDVKVGDSVYDGEIIKIDINTVVFKRLLTIALGGTKEKITTIRLIPEEEAEKK
jgi:Tfp pilus assembly protein PilP